MLEAYGRVVHRHRKAFLLVSLVVLVASGVVFSQGGTLLSYNVPRATEAGQGASLLEDQLPGAADATAIFLFAHDDLRWDDPAFREAVQAAVAPLREDPRVASVRSPYDVPAEAAATMVSRDRHDVMVLVALKDDLVTARDYFPEIRGQVRSDLLTVTATDRVAVYADMNEILEEDLIRAEVVSLPLTLLLLLVVFGTVMAALLPLGVGLLAVLGGLAGVMLLSRVSDVSVYAVNIVTLIGLGVAIDYSLFIVSRFREELARGIGVEAALGRTLATAGRATLFSGLTVLIGLVGLTFYTGLYFSSMGLAGGIVVGLAVLYALTFLPALLSLLGERVNKWPVRVPFAPRAEGRFWQRLSRRVMARPLRFLVPALAVLMIAGAPFLQMELGGAGVTQLPEHAEARVGFETLQREFPGQGLNQVNVVVEFPEGDPLARERVGALHDLSRSLAALPGVYGVQSVVDLAPGMTRADYQDLYERPRDQLPRGASEVVSRTVGSTVVVLRVLSEADEASGEAKDLVHAIRELPAPGDGRVLVTGITAMDVDTIDLIVQQTPAALAFIVGTTYVLLLLQTGSLVLPLKAILMNVLSIAASFGAMVWIFQMGNLSAILHFTPAPIDPSLPVLLFCIVFGLSMDYEVLLLSRMHEEYERTGDNAEAVAEGLAKSGRLITSAAAIMVLVFGAFGTAQVTLIKAFGLCLALAIAVDATLVRAIVVPALMRLMGKWNWWAPRPLARLWRRFG